jgi:SAM-dependent methyltransferase
MSDTIASHYRKLLQIHGDSPEAAQYSSRESQERRFAALAGIADLRGARILDYGCGTGHLLSYLDARNIRPKHYTGVDIVEELLDVGRAKHPQARFCALEAIQNEKFDYIFVSGVFNNRRRDNRRYYQATVKDLFARCERGLAFNMMSTWVDYRDVNLFYESPEKAFRFVKQHVTPFVTLRHDYEVKPGVIPFEFAIYAYCKATELSVG